MRRFLYVALMAIAFAFALLTATVTERSLAQSIGTELQTVAANPAAYPSTETPCPLALPPNEVEGQSVTCGYVTLPENYGLPEGRQGELSYAVLHSRSPAPSADPVVFLHGGPGSSLIDNLDNAVNQELDPFVSLYGPLRETRDVVLFDQRGSKFSSRCNRASNSLFFRSNSLFFALMVLISLFCSMV